MMYQHYERTDVNRVKFKGTYSALGLDQAARRADCEDGDVLVRQDAQGTAYLVSTWWDEDAENEIEYDFRELTKEEFPY
jgi:hypothetical protein